MNYFTWYWNWGNLIVGVCVGKIGLIRPQAWHVSVHVLFLTVAFGNVVDGFGEELD